MPILREPNVLLYQGPADDEHINETAERELRGLGIEVETLNTGVTYDPNRPVELRNPVWHGKELGNDILMPGTVFVLQDAHGGPPFLFAHRPDGVSHAIVDDAAADPFRDFNDPYGFTR